MLNRRMFLAGGAVSLAMPPTAFAAAGADRFREPARELKVADDCDVIVAGGGPAGLAAAVTAAKRGKRVRLFDLHGCLGGIWTSGMLGCMIDFGKSEFDREVTRRLDRYGARLRRRAKMSDSNYVADPECLKFICEALCEEAGVKVRLQTGVVAAYRDATGRNLDCIVTESKSGREVWRAKSFVDATGDGDLAAQAGCAFDVGMTSGDTTGQPASLDAIVTVKDPQAIAPFVVNEYAADGTQGANPKAALYGEIRRAGIDLSYRSPTLFKFRENLYVLVANQEYGLGVDDADAITKATLHARAEVFRTVEALKGLGGVWSGLTLVATAEQIGHRTARRIRGRYMLTADDIAEGRSFDDAVATCSFGMDIHNLTRDRSSVQSAAMRKKKSIKPCPYQIPLRACRAADLDNLYMAGRCISGDFYAQASYRVTGTACQMGEGVARAL